MNERCYLETGSHSHKLRLTLPTHSLEKKKKVKQMKIIILLCPHYGVCVNI